MGSHAELPAGYLERAAGAPLAHAAVFFVFAVAGSAYIVAAKLGGLPAALVTFLPVGFMLAYALLVGFARVLRLRDDQSGDNLYYMGFLFTLTSLAVSLYQFSAAGAAEEIVQNFGIAIASTITGIALRVFFNQIRRDPLEVERIARLELAEAATRVRRELDSTVVEFGFFRRSAQQAIMEGFEEVRAQVDAVGAKLLGGLEEVTTKSAAPLEAASKHSGETIEELTKTTVAALEASARDLSTQTERLSKSAKAIATALDGVSAKLEAMQTPDRVIEVRLEPTIQSLGRVVDKFSKQAGSQSAEIKGFLEQAKVATEQAAAATVALREGTAASTGEIKEALERTKIASENSSEALMLFRKETETNKTAMQGTIALAQQAAGAMSEAAEDMRRSTAAQADRLQPILEKVESAMTSFGQAVSRAASEETARSSTLIGVVSALERSTQSLNATVQQVAAAMNDRETGLRVVPESAA